MSQALILRQDTTLAPKMIRDTFVLEIHYVESTSKCKLGYSLEKLFFWCFKPQLLSVSTVDFFCMHDIFLSVRSSKLTYWGIYCLVSLSLESRMKPKKTHDTKTYRA